RTGQRVADDRDPAPQHPDVDSPEPASEHLHDSTRRMQPRARKLEQGRLAGSVRPEDDPPLVRTDAPVDSLEQSASRTTQDDRAEADDVRHSGADPGLVGTDA